MAEFRWFGHTCIRIKAKEAVVIADPIDRSTGFSPSKQTADIITRSSDDPRVGNLGWVKDAVHTVTGPGEYEMHDVFITGIRTHRDAEKGAQRGYNTVYVYEVEGMRVCHLGALGHPLTQDQAEAIGEPDILFVPAGGGDALTPEQAAEMVAMLEPKVVVPIRYAVDNGDTSLGNLEAFCKALGVTAPETEDKLVLKNADLGETMRLVVLKPES